MKPYPARFVGEFEREAAWNPSCVPNVGDVAIVHGYPDGRDRAYIRCACGDVDTIPITGENAWSAWSFVSREPVHLEPSVRVGPLGGETTWCHYFVHGGRLEMLDDTTRPLA